LPFPLHRLRWIRRCRGLPGRIHRCCDLLGSLRHPFGRIVSSRLDPSLLWPSRPDSSFPFYSAMGTDTNRRRRVRCCRPRGGSSTSDRSKKQGGSTCWCSFVVSPCRSLTLNVDPSRRTGFYCVSADRYHLDFGYLGISGLSSSWSTHQSLLQSQHSHHHDATTVGGFQPVGSYLRPLLQSHRVWCPRCDCRRMLDYVSVSVCGLAPLLGCQPIRVRVESIYIVSHLLSIQQSILSYNQDCLGQVGVCVYYSC
jgi:hypothetical protein